jgi:hypothetical protein
MAPAATPAAAKGAYSPSGTSWTVVLAHWATSRISSGSAVNFVALRVVDGATRAAPSVTRRSRSGARIFETALENESLQPAYGLRLLLCRQACPAVEL